MEHKAENYDCVKSNKVLKAYLEHFRQVSKNNEIPGLLSFFFIQGQIALPYLRIPVGGGTLDPRVNVFWIQDTRTGKSVAFEIIQKTLKEAGIEAVDYTTGTDAAMVGSFVKITEDNVTRHEPRAGVLAGPKAMNFDEGSIILKPNSHSEETVLYLQSALNSAGTGRNILTKHLANGTITIQSLVSLWITTFPPDGIKEYVLDKGIFQRVLLYWRDWTIDMKKEVAYELIDSIHEDPKFTMQYDDVVGYFKKLDKRLKDRVKELLSKGHKDIFKPKTDEEIKKAKEKFDNDRANASEEDKSKYADFVAPSTWDEAHPDYTSSNLSQREEWIMLLKKKLFTISPSFKPAMKAAVEEYYSLIDDMDATKQGICASFVMGLQNYTTVLAHHMAMLEETWVVTDKHVDMAKEILYDLYRNLLDWLESKVKVGQSAGEKRKLEGSWKEAFKRCAVVDFDDHRSRGWAKKQDLFSTFGNIHNLSSKSNINNKYNQVGHMFDETTDKHRKFVRLKKSADSGKNA